MPISKANEYRENLRAAYSAIADYHNNIVQARFTVTGLVIAANGFLVSAFFQSNVSVWLRIYIPILGIIIAFICWLLEIRNSHLLTNLTVRGLTIEDEFEINNNDIRKDRGFFSLMKNQYEWYPKKFIPLESEIGEKNILSELASHHAAIGLLYIIFSIFWLVMFIMLIFGF